MRKFLLLIMALLTVGVSGVWAATPAAGAYPVEGKTYYLFANKYNSTDRYYLYWDNTNSALKRASANTKENNNYYKWTVTISDGLYTITNVGTGTSLSWSGGLTLGATGSQFDLSKTIDYTACVSLWTLDAGNNGDGGRWLCVKNDTETFSSGYRYYSFPTASSDRNDYSWNFVFEEVLCAHSLTDGSYYTIYCDNDNKQYLYDNAGTLSVANASSTALNYVWECKISDGNYSFRNLQTGKYLKYYNELASTTQNFTIETTNVYHDGCVKIKSGSNYMGMATAGAFEHASHPRYSKVTTDYSFDYRFDAVDLSDWCTGTNLGGTLTQGSGTEWSYKWTSPTSPSYTLEVSENNINKTANNTGGLDIRSGKTYLSAIYTICAPTGYVVTGYEIVGYALTGNQTITPAKGGEATVFTTAGNSISVSGLRQNKASFTLSGANEGLFIRAMQVSLSPLSSIATLPVTNNNAYVIYNARAAWNFADDATSMNAVALENIDLDNEEQQIALIYHNENYYLYSVNAGKYLTANNTLTSVVTDNEQISITATGNVTYPWFFNFKNVSNKNINIDGNLVVRINSTSSLDDGNRNAIIEAVDFDATEALAMFNNRYVTYNLSYDGNNEFRTQNNVVVALGGDPRDYVPWGVPAYCSFLYDIDEIEESTTEVNVTMTWNGPFDFSSDYEHAVWYYMQIHGDRWISAGETTDGITPVITTDNMQKTDAGLWAFIGNPHDGIKLMNKNMGDGFYGQTGDYMDIKNIETEANTLLYLEEDATNSFYLKNSFNKYFEFWGPDYGNQVGCYYNTKKDPNYNRVTVRSYYCQQALDNWNNYVGGSTEGYFKVKPQNNTQFVAMITGMPQMTKTQYDESWATIPNDNIRGYITFNQPTTGYYRIKNNETGDYIAYGQPVAAYNEKTPGLIAISSEDVATNVSSVIKLTGSAGTYKLSTEGLNVQYQTRDNQAFPATDSEGVNFVFNVATPGIVSITNAASRVDDDYDGSLHNATGWIVNGIVNWKASSEYSKWVVEDAEELTIPLTQVGAYYYATMCLPFDVTISGATAYTLTLNQAKNGLTLSEGMSLVPAGTPVVLRGETGNSATASFSNSSEYQASPLTTTALTGTYTSLDVTSTHTTDYFLGVVDGKIGFYHWAGTELAANRAYFQASKLSDNVKGFALDFDSVDGVRVIEQNASSGSEWYDLSGRRVAQPTHGIYIKNGQKVVVK